VLPRDLTRAEVEGLQPGSPLTLPHGAVTVPVFQRVQDYSGVWAIEPRAGQQLLDLARRIDMAAHVALAQATPPHPRSALALQPDGRGKSVATIRVEGTLMKQRSSLGGSGTVQMRRDIRQAANDADVSAILLAIDSPGGTVSGTDDLAAEVRAATKKKPVYAFVSDLCASAAYWVASQADAIYANSDTALIGSIGTLMTVYDLSRAAEKQGVEAVVFATGPLKGAGAEGTAITAEQRAYFQAIVDDSQKAFDAAVRTGRGLTDGQLNAVRTGGVFVAPEAVAKKLIDGVQTYEATFAALVKEASSRSRSSRTAADPVFNRGAVMSRTTMPDDVVDLTTADGGYNPDAALPSARRTTRDAVGEAEAEANRRIAANFRRIADIQKVAAKHPAILAQAVEEGWTAEAAELAVLRADVPKTPAASNPHLITAGGADRATIEAALCLSLGVREKIIADGLPAADRERVMNQAADGRLKGYSLHALMDDVIRAAGHTYHGQRKTSSHVEAALRADFQLRASGSGFSTIGLSGILANVANKALLNAYTAVNVVWRMIAAVRSHSDFKTVTRYRLDSSGALKKVGQDGEIKHVGLDNVGYTNKVETFAAMLALTRQMMINDDLGAFASLPAFLGRMAALRIEELVFALILANTGSFFSSGNNNLLTGAGSALTDTGAALDAAETAFLNMVDSNGKPVLTTPQVLLVPTTLKPIATRLYTGGALITGETSVTRVADNTFVGRYPPVVSPYLNNTALRDQDGAAFSGQSATAHYLFADPTDRAAIGVAFLNGMQQPTIETAETDFNTLGQQWRIFHDFGAAFEDTTAAVKSSGA
jgi:signal peptide peptidase SppA